MSSPSNKSLEQAIALHRETFVFDAHVDTVSTMLDKGYHLGDAPPEAHLSWEHIDEGGLSAQMFACWVNPGLPQDAYADRVHTVIDRFEQEVRRFPDRLSACKSSAEVREAVSQGKFAGWLSIEGGHAIEDSLENLRRFYDRGIRAMTLTWNNSNGWADGCGPMEPTLPKHDGLSEFGRTVVQTMNELGMAVDVSHAAVPTFWDVIETSSKPVYASHSCAAAVNPHRRNLDDDQLKALRDKDGVVGLCLVSGFLMDESQSWAAAKQSPAYAAIQDKTDMIDFAGISEQEFVLYAKEVPLAGLEHGAAHAEHLLNILGTDQIAFGTDFDGAARFPQGIDHVGKLPLFTAALLDRGWKASELQGFLGKNLLDFFSRIEIS